MAAKLEKTTTPGIFKRGDRYAVIYRDPAGRQRQESARTYDDARRLRRRRSASVDDGTYQPQTREKFSTYATAWVERYRGNGRRGFTEHTRNDYRRDLERYALPRLGNLRLEQITPRHIAEFVAWLCDEQEQGRREAGERREAEAAKRSVSPSMLRVEAEPKHLADASVQRILSPLRACLHTATAEGLIRHNPTVGVALPARDDQRRISLGEDQLEDEREARTLSDAQLATLLAVAPTRHRLLFELLAATGLRISEALALRWGDLSLDGEHPVVQVRRAYVKGTFKPPKSRYGRRAVPIEFELVRKLRRARSDSERPGERELVFASRRGTPLEYGNLHRRVLKPAAGEAGVPWAAFHTLRHTCASRLFAQGRNAVQVQRWLGHHSPAFTLARYVHLLNDDLGGPLAAPESSSTGDVQTTDGTVGGDADALDLTPLDHRDAKRLSVKLQGALRAA
jgi:integrase